jgi:hypothetical protein
MNDDDPRDVADFLDVIASLRNACANLPLRDQLKALEVTWLCVAQDARTEASATPDGFVAEQSRQRERLERMITLLDAEAPDVGDRNADVNALLRRVRQMRDGTDTH